MKTVIANYAFSAYPNGTLEAFDEGASYQISDEFARAWEDNGVVTIKGDARKADQNTEALTISN